MTCHLKKAVCLYHMKIGKILKTIGTQIFLQTREPKATWQHLMNSRGTFCKKAATRPFSCDTNGTHIGILIVTFVLRLTVPLKRIDMGPLLIRFNGTVKRNT